MHLRPVKRLLKFAFARKSHRGSRLNNVHYSLLMKRFLVALKLHSERF